MRKSAPRLPKLEGVVANLGNARIYTVFFFKYTASLIEVFVEQPLASPRSANKIQGVFLTGPPLKFLSAKFLYNLWHLEKFWANLVLRDLRLCQI